MNAERLLGSLLLGGLGRGPGLRREARVALGLGAVALAAAAFEHFVEQRRGGAAGAPPGERVAPPPAPPSLPPAPPRAGTHDTLLLVRAMVAAAGADGVIDVDERDAILDRLANSGLGDEERAFVAGELECPPTREAIVAEVTSPHLAEQVYTASLLAVRPDGEAERAYLRALAADLALPTETLQRVHAALGVTAV